MLLKDVPLARKSIDIDKVISVSKRARATLLEVRDRMLEPHPRKTPPVISSTRLMQLLDVDRSRFNYLIQKGEIPNGIIKGSNRGREFLLAVVQDTVRRLVPERLRPPGAPGMTLCVGNFKGGVGKTTLAVALAQGLSLHGHKVCMMDLDPQASTTTLFGKVPEAEVEESETVMPLVYGDVETLAGVPQETYWPGIDLIPSAPYLFGADYFLPSRQADDPSFEFWELLNGAMDPLRDKYDVIIIDTPPTLSYLATAAFMASDGMIVPVPPEALDYASSTMFWGQFAELFASLRDSRKLSKTFDFVKIVLSKVKAKKVKDRMDATDATRSLLQHTYPEFIGRCELPVSDVVSNAAAEFRTLYDLSSYAGSAKAVAAFDAFVEEIELEMLETWKSVQEEVTDGVS
ncbi:ParA family protein [Noviherbaspirillum aerium]|uniref:ParA family protein n=1 Tax=Noviherbaspirillum aerium TaxID=2588497 RepID=UPI00124DBEAA|nr:AAA family ATPase [Noviherbaspirillum aerium]